MRNHLGISTVVSNNSMGVDFRMITEVSFFRAEQLADQTCASDLALPGHGQHYQHRHLDLTLTCP
jgi:hypothetical protein